MNLLERVRDEADLCRNDGADDVANLLDEVATRIAALEERVRVLEGEVAAAEQRGQAAMRDKAAKVARDHGETWGLAYRSMTDTIATAIESLPTEGEQ